MADCGANGTAIDRTAESAVRAGKVVAGFFGSVATNSTAGPSLHSHGMSMPNVKPQIITAPLSHNNCSLYSTTLPLDQDIVPLTSQCHNQLNLPPNLISLNAHQQTLNINHVNHMKLQAQVQMQSQMQFMAQHMKMMNIQQQQQQQQFKETKSAVTVKATHGESKEWFDELEKDFEAYFKSNGRGSTSRDVESTADQSDIGHEGFVEDASIEQLAAAWSEAETAYALKDEDISNLADPYNTAFGSHLHYDFSETSRHAHTKEAGNDFMEEGLRYFRDGNTADAIVCFEKELLNNGMDNADAWLMLGKCNAENDEDRKAIVCLENAVERDPYSCDALLALGVSYVNELNHQKALESLMSWVTNNPHYAGLDSTLEVNNDGEDGALIKLKALLNRAKEYDESNSNNESAVGILEALGVVCNVTREYDEAVKYFKIAAAIKPEDYTLWNKLGATLANSNKSDEAQASYQRALSIKPKYARAWLNMAISHSNLKNYDESARCYLQTLSLNPRATHVWSYLRIALTCSERWELLNLAANQDLNGLKEHFDFV